MTAFFNRHHMADLISQTYLSAQMVRVAIDEVERYERECQG